MTSPSPSTSAQAGCTPGPWRVVEDGWQPWDGAIQIVGADGEIIAYTTSGANEKINAPLIVRAVNRDAQFEAMKAALVDALVAARSEVAEIRTNICEVHDTGKFGMDDPRFDEHAKKLYAAKE